MNFYKICKAYLARSNISCGECRSILILNSSLHKTVLFCAWLWTVKVCRIQKLSNNMITWKYSNLYFHQGSFIYSCNIFQVYKFDWLIDWYMKTSLKIEILCVLFPWLSEASLSSTASWWEAEGRVNLLIRDPRYCVAEYCSWAPGMT